MVQIPEEALRLIVKNGNVVFVGSADANGVPNISPRFVLAVIENERLLFLDAFKHKTFQNLNTSKKVSVAVIDKETMGGFQIKGETEEVTDKNLVAEASKKLREYGISAKPQRAWVITAREIFSLKPDQKSKTPILSAYQ
jgi:predicted pyridoxine 5'-phosphate oxidase superfamily flavin-nucleotide-binding protein